MTVFNQTNIPNNTSTSETLRSKTNISFVDLLCEGQIQGLVNGAKSIYLNETQLQNDAGKFNFDGVTYQERFGTNTQTALSNVPAVENEINVNTQLTKDGGALVRTISDSDITNARIKVRLPALMYQASNGDVNGSSVQIRIEVQANGGGYKPIILGGAYSRTGVTEVSSLHESCANTATRIKGSISLTGESYTEPQDWGWGFFWAEFGGEPPAPQTTWYAFTYNIEYRAIGAATWKVYQTVNVTELIDAWTDDFTIEGLALDEYECRVRVTSSAGGNPANVTGTLECQFYQGLTYDTITGKATDGYERDYEISLTGDAPWDIRLTRLTSDSTDVRLQNDTYWSNYTEIISQKFRYPNSALIGIKYDSKAFSSTPSRAYDVKLKLIKVPTNYDPIRKTYRGIWDGTFQTVWSDNPAWCFYDLLTNTRYGLGNYIPAAQIDKWTLYSIGQYCDQPVNNGKGGKEPRFTCNMYIQTRQEAFKLLNDFVSIFRSMIYWSNGSVTFAVDAPRDASAIFGMSNVANGSFTYAGSSAKTRHTVALVTWNDPDDFYRQKVESVEDKDGIARYGIIQAEVVAMGCTSQSQARRVGKWLLYSDQYETETVAFSTGLEGLTVRPNDLIKIQDPARAGVRNSGRVSAATTTQITIDSDFSLPSGSTMYCNLPNGSIESKTVASKTGKVITLTSALSDIPQVGSVWMVSAPSVELQTFRVISITEGKDGNVDISALKYDAAKYAYIENDEPLPVRDYSNISILPTAPTTVTTAESLYTYQAEVRSKITINWSKGGQASEYRIDYRRDNGNFTTVRTTDREIEILNTTPATYEIRVWSINVLGKQSSTYTTKTITALGKTAPPSNVGTVTYSIDPNVGVTLDWADVSDLDINYYEIRKGASWDSATFVARVKASTYLLGKTLEGTATYLVKALDTSNIYSATASSVTFTINDAAAPTISYAFEKNQVALDWFEVKGDLNTDSYEIRYGSDWATGTVLGKVKTTYFRTTINWLGNRSFFVAAIDIAGNYGDVGTIVVPVAAPANTALATYVYTDTALTTATITIDWADVNPTHGLSFYEISYDSVVKNVNASTITVPANWIGNKNFTIKTVDLVGNKSSGYVLIATKSLPNPATNFRSQVIDNNVLFYWDLPAKTSLPISHVILKKGATYAGAVSFGTKSGGFTSIQENAAGTYTYWLTVVDTDNNESTPVSITSKVAEPPDFIFYGTFESALNGTKSSAITELGHIVLPVNTTETWADHFTTRTWTSPSDQITAGYPIYIQPTPSGYYEETFDYGTILASSKVTLTYTGTTIAGTPILNNRISVSDDDITYVDYDGVNEVFVTNFRYVKVRVSVSSADSKGVYTLESLSVKLDAKQKTDSNSQACVSTDTLGTITNFSKEFVDIQAINVTPTGTTPVTAIYDFQDANLNATYSVTSNVCTVTATAHGMITGQNVRLYFSSGTAPSGIYTLTGYTANTFTVSMTTGNTSGNCLVYPQGFRIYLFNSAGTRVSGTASWSARGY